jgi:hypothetical protein
LCTRQGSARLADLDAPERELRAHELGACSQQQRRTVQAQRCEDFGCVSAPPQEQQAAREHHARVQRIRSVTAFAQHRQRLAQA